MSFDSSITVDDAYASWIAELKKRYRTTQIKAAVSVNSALLEFYWLLGRDIVRRYPERRRGGAFYSQLSADLKSALPDSSGLSPRNLRYAAAFFVLFSSLQAPSCYLQQPVECQKDAEHTGKLQFCNGEAFLQQAVFSIPWGHHTVIIDKCGDDRDKAFYYARKAFAQGWSRSVLLNMIGTDAYSREKNAQTNFPATLPLRDSDLARELMKDPFLLGVQNLAEPVLERDLKKAICSNIESLLLQMGKGVAFLGREYRIDVGDDELFADLLFYIVPLRRYLVLEVKTDKFKPADLGQLHGYVAAVNHTLNLPDDKPAIGLIVCREHNRLLAKLMLDDVSSPMAVADYELVKIIPERIQRILPTLATGETQNAEL